MRLLKQWLRPCCSNTSVGIPDILTNESEALLVEPKDKASLLSAISRLIEDENYGIPSPCRGIFFVRKILQ